MNLQDLHLDTDYFGNKRLTKMLRILWELPTTEYRCFGNKDNYNGITLNKINFKL